MFVIAVSSQRQRHANYSLPPLFRPEFLPAMMQSTVVHAERINFANIRQLFRSNIDCCPSERPSPTRCKLERRDGVIKLLKSSES